MKKKSKSKKILIQLQEENKILREKVDNLERFMNEYKAKPKECFDKMAQYIVPKMRAHNYEMLLAEYKFQGFSKDLLHSFERLEVSMYCWRSENNRLWLLYLTILLENNLHEKIEFLSRRYYYYHQLENVEDYPYVAHYFHKQNYTNELIEKSALIHEKLMEAEQNQEFEKLVRGKSIAVVANGPYEKGKGRGKEIDSHDIVVRFSQGTDKGFEKDYGKRTDIWVNTVGCKNFLRYRKPDLLFTLWRFDCYFFRDESGIENLYSVLDKKCQKYGDKTAQYAWKELGINISLTSGSDFILHLYNVLGSFENIDLYGFHFMHNFENEKLYFNRNTSYVPVDYHDFDVEKNVMLKFLLEHGGEKFI